jgi:DNA primase
MAGRIPDETLQAIRERVSLVEVVSGYVALKKTGRNHVGLCPFHSEKTPSFTVNEERGLFHCFGCGAGGTVFTFLMRADHIEFPEAVEILARRAGVALPARAERGEGGDQRQQLFALNDAAQRYLRAAVQSPAGLPARQYLERRGVQAATVERYGIGFCPPAGAGLARALAAQKSPMPKAAELGLVGRRNDGSFYDRFWGRVTFPIRDGSGRILGFGGRTLGNEHPKYLNSPESALFHKGQVLYGLFEAREAIRHAERAVIVEGYLDALALVEAGIGYAVASLGTAFTKAQLQLIRRFAPEMIAFFDGDRAGQEAAIRAFGVCAEAGVWGLGAFLPEGFDPDTHVRERGAEATLALLQAAIPLADFFFSHLDPGSNATVLERNRAAEKIAQVVARTRDPFQFERLAKQAAERLDVDESLFRALRASVTQAEGSKPSVAADKPVQPFRNEETTLLVAMALDREVAALVAHRDVLDLFASSALAEGARAVLAAWEHEHNSASAIDRLPASVAARVTEGLLGEGAVASGDRLQTARECIETIYRRRHDVQSHEGKMRVRQAEASGDPARVREELRRYDDLLRNRETERG